VPVVFPHSVGSFPSCFPDLSCSPIGASPQGSPPALVAIMQPDAVGLVWRIPSLCFWPNSEGTQSSMVFLSNSLP
jgi:hypothetical protein